MADTISVLKHPDFMGMALGNQVVLLSDTVFAARIALLWPSIIVLKTNHKIRKTLLSSENGGISLLCTQTHLFWREFKKEIIIYVDA
jgi:hypothetical protein